MRSGSARRSDYGLPRSGLVQSVFTFDRNRRSPWAGIRRQRLPAFHKLAAMLGDHLDGILNYCRTPVRFGVVEAINGNIKALLRRGRGYTNLRYLLLKAQRQAATKIEFITLRKAA